MSLSTLTAAVAAVLSATTCLPAFPTSGGVSPGSRRGTLTTPSWVAAAFRCAKSRQDRPGRCRSSFVDPDDCGAGFDRCPRDPRP